MYKNGRLYYWSVIRKKKLWCSDVCQLFHIHFILSLQDWFAFLNDDRSNYNFTITGEVIFPNIGIPTAYDNYGFCQVFHFDVITVGHLRIKKRCC